MRIPYSIAIGLYAIGVRIAALFNSKANLLAKGWKGWQAKVAFDKLDNSKVAWFHASSLGEFEQARPVIEAFRKKYPEYKTCLTFFSPSGYEIRKNYPCADLVCYLPPDTRRNAMRFIRLIHPDIAFFVKYDFWFNYLNTLNRRGTPTYIFSAIFRPKQYFFRWYGHWFAKQLFCYRHIFVQNVESMELLEKIGIKNVSVTGDTRYDRVIDIAKNVKPIDAIERFIEQSFNPTDNQSDKPEVLIAGSSWEPDEQNIKAFLDRYVKPLLLILAPHMIDEGHLQKIEHLFGPDRCLRYSVLNDSMSENVCNGRNILIIDNIGMLSAIYQYAYVAYIGGGFGKGIHNILEATAYHIPVCFGPNYHKFKEARDMIAAGAAQSYDTADELTDILTKWFDNNDTYSQAKQACQNAMSEEGGSTQAIMSKIEASVAR